MPELICPRCGKTNDEVQFIEAFCINCYPLDIKIPNRIELEQCKSCKKIKIKGEWTPYKKKRMSDYIVAKCKGNFDDAEYDDVENIIEFIIKRHGAEIKVKKEVNININSNMCRDCSRVSGGYFQGVIQLRGNRKMIEKYEKKFLSELEKKTFITRMDEKDGGVDIQIGNSKAVVALLTQMRIKALITKKLVGAEQGRRLYRTTFRIRFD